MFFILYYRTFPKKKQKHQIFYVDVGGAHVHFPWMTSSRFLFELTKTCLPFSNPRCNEIFSPPLMTLFVVCVCDGKGIQERWKCVYTDIYEKIMFEKKKWNTFYLQHFFNFQIHLGEKRFQILSTFVKQLYLTTVGRWFLQHLERIAKSLPSSQLPQLARNRTPRLPLGEIHLHPHS